MNRKTGRGKDMSWDLRALGGAVQLPCGELAWTKPQIFRVLASVEAMRGVVLGGDVLFGNGTYTGSSWQYCLSCEDHYVAFLRENCRDSRRTAEAFIRDFLATRSGEFLFAPLRKLVDEKCFYKTNHGPVVPAVMGNDAGIVGAAMLRRDADA